MFIYSFLVSVQYMIFFYFGVSLLCGCIIKLSGCLISINYWLIAYCISCVCYNYQWLFAVKYYFHACGTLICLAFSSVILQLNIVNGIT